MKQAGQMGCACDVCCVELRVEAECQCLLRTLHHGKNCCCGHSVAGGLRGAEARPQTLVEQRREVQQVGLCPLQPLQAVAKGGVTLAVPGGGSGGGVHRGGRLNPVDGPASPCTRMSY